MSTISSFELRGLGACIGGSKIQISVEETALISNAFLALKRNPLTFETIKLFDGQDACLATPVLPGKKFYMAYTISNEIITLMEVGYWDDLH